MIIPLSLFNLAFAHLRARWHEARAADDGSFTLEQAVIAAALLALAIGLAVVLTNAVTNHESTIK